LLLTYFFKNGNGFPLFEPFTLGIQFDPCYGFECVSTKVAALRGGAFPPLTNGLRKCGIYTQWNFMQP
jgi:hypothetical protein